MDPLEELYDEVQEKGIEVIDEHFSETKKGACLHSEDYSVILIDRPRIETRAEERVILQEEYSHYETGGLYLIEATCNTAIGRRNRIIAEGRARRHMIEKLLPFEALKAVCKAWRYSKEELAEHFDVTEELVGMAYELYESLGLAIWDEQDTDW